MKFGIVFALVAIIISAVYASLPGSQLPGSQLPGSQLPGSQLPEIQVPESQLPECQSESTAREIIAPENQSPEAHEEFENESLNVIINRITTIIDPLLYQLIDNSPADPYLRPFLQLLMMLQNDCDWEYFCYE